MAGRIEYSKKELTSVQSSKFIHLFFFFLYLYLFFLYLYLFSLLYLFFLYPWISQPVDLSFLSLEMCHLTERSFFLMPKNSTWITRMMFPVFWMQRIISKGGVSFSVFTELSQFRKMCSIIHAPPHYPSIHVRTELRNQIFCGACVQISRGTPFYRAFLPPMTGQNHSQCMVIYQGLFSVLLWKSLHFWVFRVPEVPEVERDGGVKRQNTHNCSLIWLICGFSPEPIGQHWK